jgi:hypothetical protein
MFFIGVQKGCTKLVEMSFRGAQKDKRGHVAGRNVFYNGAKGQKGTRCRLKCLLQGFKRTKGGMWPVEMSFIEVQKDKRVHEAG